MSKSSRTSYRHTTKSTAHATAPAGGCTARDRAPERHRINFGPALAAVHDVAAWALGLAARDVAGWPEGRRRVRSARRYILARLQGKRPQDVPTEDGLFTAGLLARIFEAELHLPITQVVAILDRIGLPADDVPIVPRASSPTWQDQAPMSGAGTPLAPSAPTGAVATSAPAAPSAPIAPIAPVMPIRPQRAPVPTAPAPVCDRCGQFDPRFRIAA